MTLFYLKLVIDGIISNWPCSAACLIQNYSPDYTLNCASSSPITYGLLTKCEVKVTGYAKFFLCMFMDQNGVKVHKHKMNKANTQPS